MVKVEETTQGVLDKISEGFAQKGAFKSPWAEWYFHLSR